MVSVEQGRYSEMVRSDRAQSLWDLGNFGTGRGLEIGPLAAPVVLRDEADVRYLDILDQEGLRAHYAHDPGVPSERIDVVDYPLIVNGRTRSMVEAAAEGAPFAWVMASHVIEHVPDVIGWLAEIAELTDDGGRLVMAVPDKRYCFDVHRPTTTVGAMMQAHLDLDERPSVRAVFDHIRDASRVDTSRLWDGHKPGPEARIHSLEQAQDLVRATGNGEYVDSHVWLFTPELFLAQMHEIRIAGLSSWLVERMVPTARDGLEFYVVMRRLPRGEDATLLELDHEVLPATSWPFWSEPEVANVNQIAHLRKLVRAQRRTIRRQRGELRSLRASTTWRLGSALIRPADSVRRRFRRG